MKLGTCLFAGFLIISINLSCSDAPNAEPASPNPTKQTTLEVPFSENQYDSIQYFKEAEWTTLKGINELAKTELSYPFMAFAHKKQLTDIYIAFDQNRIVKWHLNKYQSTRYIKLRHYDKEYRDSAYLYWLYNDASGKLVQVNCFSGNLFKEEKSAPRMILQASRVDSLSIIQAYYFGNSQQLPVILRDILTFDSLAFKGKFDTKETSLLRIKEGALYKTALMREDYIWNKRDSGSEEAVLVPEFEYPSFFYYYTSLYEDWDSVRDENAN